MFKSVYLATASASNLSDNIFLLDDIEKDYNQLIDDYKTSKIKEDEFNAKREGLLLQISTLKNKYDNPENNSYFVRIGNRATVRRVKLPKEVEQIKYTQIERLKGIKDKIEVGVTLPVIERQEKATLTIKRDPLIILNRNTKKDIVAIKLRPSFYDYYDQFPESVLTFFNKSFKIPDILDAVHKFPKSWRWEVTCKLINNQEEKLRWLCDENKQPVIYTQNLDHFVKLSGNTIVGRGGIPPVPIAVSPPHSSKGYCLGYSRDQLQAVYINTVSFNEETAYESAEAERIERRHGPMSKAYYNNFNSNYVRDNIHISYAPFILVDWHYQGETFTLEIEKNSWVTFRLNTSKTLSIQKVKSTITKRIGKSQRHNTVEYAETEWIPITVIS